MSDIVKQLETDARDIDCTVDVLTGGPAGMTVSKRAALAAKAGKWPGCLMCWFLNWAVQPRHCEQVLDPNSVTPTSVYIRAGIAFTSGFVGIGLIVRWVVRAVF